MADDTPAWERRAQAAEKKIEEALWGAGFGGLTIAQLRQVVGVGKETFDGGLRRFRGGQLCVEARELRQDRAGRWRQQSVLRLSIANDEGAEPLHVSRDPDVVSGLTDIAASQRLRDEISRAQASGLKEPDAIARAILHRSVDATFLLQLFEAELQRLLAERVAAEFETGVVGL
jgi:hypothetical protein